MKNRFFTLLLTLCILMMAALPAFATEATEATEPTNVPREPGYCGEDITWTYHDGTLIITGYGEMDDFPEGTPWAEYQDEVTDIIISNDITYIGAYAFRDFDALETVDFGEDVYEIGTEAFCSCDSLTAVYLPESFKVFGESSFMSCRNLKEFHCEGRFPSFRLNCLWDTYGVIYFPAQKPWSVDNIAQLEEAFHGRIEFLASDGSDPYDPTEATEVPTTEPETTPPTTEAPTEAPTQPATEAPSEPVVTEAPTAPETEPETQAPETTVPSTEPAQEEEKGGSWIGLLIIGIVAVFLILGSLIFRGRRGGRYAK